MNLYLVTGLAGSGKSQLINTLEDCGFYCVDNVPAGLLYKFVTLICHSLSAQRDVAIVSDSRSGLVSDDFLRAVNELKKDGIKFSVIFLDASGDVLQSRFKETRRKHPLIDDADGILPVAIELEREHMSGIKNIADYVIDTTDTTPSSLRRQVISMFGSDSQKNMNVVCMSFGTKYGGVAYADLLFDVRCLPNPYYIPELKQHTGLESCVSDYVMSSPEAVKLRDKLFDLIDMLLPLYQREGKTQIVIGFACTGGQHRSVTFAEAMGKHVADLGYPVVINHRDIDRKSKK
ncbi:MAG: RNase adapter RapZ [Firmicutes bacterium]|nr:RNase adapter RapZ [Bacillota bacterium]